MLSQGGESNHSEDIPKKPSNVVNKQVLLCKLRDQVCLMNDSSGRSLRKIQLQLTQHMHIFAQILKLPWNPMHWTVRW